MTNWIRELVVPTKAGPKFLGVRWMETALDFPIDALYSHPKLRQAGALQDTLVATKRLG
jgi:hypothetical protein